jgi:DNA-binding protein HU-beta
MNKAELVSAVAEKSGLTKVQAAQAVKAFMEATAETLRNGDRLSLVGFGTFYVSERGERKGRNPQTGKVVTIPAKKVVKFKSGSDLKF